MSTNQKKAIEKIRDYYLEKDETKLDRIVKLNDKAHLPAEIFSYTFGAAGSLVLGTGMCFAMKVIGAGLSFAIPMGIGIGLVGMAMVSINYFIYKKIIKKGKQKYGEEIIKLSNELLNEQN